MSAAIMLAIDPSFTATGWVAVELIGEGRVVACGLVRTAPPKKEARLTAAEANAARGCAIRREITAAIAMHAPVLVVQEGNAGSQSAKAAAALARAQQACVDAVDMAIGAPPILVTPQSVKKAAVGLLHCTKGDMQRAALARWTSGLVFAVNKLCAGTRMKPDANVLENVYDAACVAASVWHRPDVAAMRLMAERGAA